MSNDNPGLEIALLSKCSLCYTFKLACITKRWDKNKI